MRIRLSASVLCVWKGEAREVSCSNCIHELERLWNGSIDEMPVHAVNTTFVISAATLSVSTPPTPIHLGVLGRLIPSSSTSIAPNSSLNELFMLLFSCSMYGGEIDSAPFTSGFFFFWQPVHVRWLSTPKVHGGAIARAAVYMHVTYVADNFLIMDSDNWKDEERERKKKETAPLSWRYIPAFFVSPAGCVFRSFAYKCSKSCIIFACTFCTMEQFLRTAVPEDRTFVIRWMGTMNTYRIYLVTYA